MSKEVYNLGRVVGYSAYEIYLKHALAENPELEPATEREWLASQLAYGTSMILKVPVDTNSNAHYVDFKLPENSNLSTANTIVATQFFGKCAWDARGWATKVIDYGQGISNTSSRHPDPDVNLYADTYPSGTISQFRDDVEKVQFLQYMKIQDGVVLQPGVWRVTDHGQPYEDFIPNLSKVPVVRLVFASRIVEEFYVMLTGFTNRSVLAGITGIDEGSTEEVSPENGDFLGPELYPWANKITFTYPAIAAYYLRKGLSIGDIPEAVQTYLSSYPNTSTLRAKNARIDYSDDSIYTKWNTSYILPDKGISVHGPTSDAGPIIIGSKVGTTGSAANYIKVTQPDGGSTTAEAEVTTLTPSHLIPISGIAIAEPASAGKDIAVSSRIFSDNNYLAIKQYDNESQKGTISRNLGDSRNASSIQTILKVSPVFSNDTSGIKIISPLANGDPVYVSAPIVVDPSVSSYLKVSQTGSLNDSKTVLKPAPISGDGIINVDVTDAGIELTLDYVTLAERMLQYDNKLKSLLNEILGKIGKGGSRLSYKASTGPYIYWDVGHVTLTDWSIPIGNLNIESSNRHYIRCHTGNEDGDIKVN